VTVRGLDAVGRTKEEYLNLADAAVADLTNESGLTERQADRFVDLIIGPPLLSFPVRGRTVELRRAGLGFAFCYTPKRRGLIVNLFWFLIRVKETRGPLVVPRKLKLVKLLHDEGSKEGASVV